MSACTAPWQPSLLDLDPPSIDVSFAGLRRLELGSGAWVDHAPRWLTGHAEVFEAVRSTTRWRRQRRPMYERVVDVPRLVASLPEDGPGHPVVDAIAAALSRRYRSDLTRVAVALYRDGRDSVAWHGDRVPRPDDCLVATVSVGEPRRFRMRPHGGGRSFALSLGWGDLVVMGGTCQATWEHCVPKAASAGPRISIMFRQGPRPRRDPGVVDLPMV